MTALLSLVSIWAMIVLYYPALPDLVPRHFNEQSGQPDNWGTKSNILILPIIGTFIYILMTVLNRFPHIFNYPVEISDRNARSQYAVARQLVTSLKALILLTLAGSLSDPFPRPHGPVAQKFST